jgi:hypothetical protein
MDSNLITPPDILNNGLHSVVLVDPEQSDVDAVVRFCQYSDQLFNVYVYTPNMENKDWLSQAVDASDTVIVNTRTNKYNDLGLLTKTYYYGPQNFVENQKKLADPLHYFAAKHYADK